MFETAKSRSILFVVLVAVISIAVDQLVARGVFGGAGSLAYMWCPALSALVASVISRRSLKEIGWRPRLKWLALGWVIPVACAFVAYGLVWLTGLGGVPRARFLERARIVLNMQASRPDWLVIVAAFGFITLWLLLPSMISALGEEIGWRGFLVPELDQWLGFRGAAVVSGVVWAMWHLPAVLFRGYGVEGTPKAYQLACFTAMVMASAVVMAWLRLRSRSIWPAVVMHAAHNAAIQLFFDAITDPRKYTQYFIGEFGIGLALPIGIVAFYCVRDMKRRRESLQFEPSPVPIAAD